MSNMSEQWLFIQYTTTFKSSFSLALTDQLCAALYSAFFNKRSNLIAKRDSL